MVFLLAVVLVVGAVIVAGSIFLLIPGPLLTCGHGQGSAE